MFKVNRPVQYLSILLAFQLFSLTSCKEDKKNDPDPIPPVNTVTPCTDLDVTMLTDKKWYKVDSNGESWVLFNSDGNWASLNTPYQPHTINGKGTWSKSSGTCVLDIQSRSGSTQYFNVIKIMSIGANEVTIGNRFDFSNLITYKTTP